jgi:LPXTG-site transpeptidase (sortase) family protein
MSDKPISESRKSPFDDSTKPSEVKSNQNSISDRSGVNLAPDKLTRAQRLRRALLRALSLGETDYLRVRGSFIAIEQNTEGELTQLGEGTRSILKVVFLPLWAGIHTYWMTKRLFDRVSFLRTAVIYTCIAALVFGAVNYQTILTQISYTLHKPSQTLAIAGIKSQAPSEKPKPAPTQEARIMIPKIGVDAPIVFAQSRDEKDIQQNLQNGVVHYPGTAMPGELGNVFLTGHSSNYSWAKGHYNYVFTLIEKMSPGDVVIIYYNGGEYDYQVTGTKIVEPTQIEVLNPTPTRVLSLMSCWPVYTSQKRMIVLAQQISPKDTSLNSNNTGIHLPSQ